MDFITGYTSIVGLIGLFKQLRDAHEKMDLKDFTEWLIEHKFECIVPQLEDNKNISTAIENLLRLNHDEVIERLSNIDYILATISTKMDGIQQISRAILPNEGLSAQAIKILKRSINSGKDCFCIMPGHGGRLFIDFLDEQGLMASERFLEDDLKNLEEYGLILKDAIKHKCYNLRKVAGDYLNSIDKKI